MLIEAQTFTSNVYFLGVDYISSTLSYKLEKIFTFAHLQKTTWDFSKHKTDAAVSFLLF